MPAWFTTSCTSRVWSSCADWWTKASSVRSSPLRGEFGYWVFEGDGQPGQRPCWNYRAEDGGGITVDMFCHWNYVLEGILGTVESVHREGRDPHPHPLGRNRKAYDGDRRRRLLRHLRNGGRGGRPDQLVLGGPGLP